ncbi:MAG: phosphodiester glycosidase family protein [Kiritimatiellae bacterium]|nr:phosphodiester glycosidase family protein [Kiritimatiellia bacterium]
MKPRVLIAVALALLPVPIPALPANAVVFVRNPPRAGEGGPLVCWTETRTRPRPLAVHVIRLDLHNPRYALTVLLADDPDGDGPAEAILDMPHALLKKHGAIAAVNANAWIGLPDAAGKQEMVFTLYAPVDIYGLAAADGQIRSRAEWRRVSFWIDAAGNPHFERSELTPAARCGVADWRGWLLKHGKIVPEPGGDPHPLTALGLDRTKRWLFLIVADGRSPGYSEGMTLHELGAWMQEKGCHDAINLDGGGSSIMLVAEQGGKAKMINRPCGRTIRPLPVMIGVRGKPMENEE